TYGSGAQDYDDAAQDFWQYVAMRSVERLDLQPGERVLDVPCGTGAALVAAALEVGPNGRATGIDYASESAFMDSTTFGAPSPSVYPCAVSTTMTRPNGQRPLAAARPVGLAGDSSWDPP
ncbi:MAG: class I SAM-dependent methyltransferase, partial [Actinomycetota bacterium]|nr:class I SAM-dependent methyltransferase [Actinomycetota bacterium]